LVAFAECAFAYFHRVFTLNNLYIQPLYKCFTHETHNKHKLNGGGLWMIGISIVTAFWAATAFFGGFTFTAWKKWVCLTMCVVSGIFMLIYASGIIAEGMMVDGIGMLWNVLNGFTGADVVATFFALIAGLWFGDHYHK